MFSHNDFLSSVRGLVSKAVEIADFAIYCSSSNGSFGLSADSTRDSQSPRNGQYEGNPYSHLLEPMDVYVSLLVCTMPGYLFHKCMPFWFDLGRGYIDVRGYYWFVMAVTIPICMVSCVPDNIDSKL